jgi:hypothetical protein
MSCRALPLGLCALACVAVGCGPARPRLVPVAGRVTVGGKPLSFGSVQFLADAARGNPSLEVPLAAVRPDGGYALETGGKKGAPPGWWKVVVLADNLRADDPPPSPVWPRLPAGYRPPRPLVHERYLKVATTDLAVEVVEKPPEGAYDLVLKP